MHPRYGLLLMLGLCLSLVASCGDDDDKESSPAVLNAIDVVSLSDKFETIESSGNQGHFLVNADTLYFTHNEGSQAIRHLQFNGDKTAPVFKDLSGDTTTGIAALRGEVTTYPNSVFFNDKFYLAFNNNSVGAGPVTVITQQATGGWKIVTPNNLSFASASTADARLLVLGTKLYVIWTELNAYDLDKIRQIWAAVYNGDDNNPDWTLVDPGPTGFNRDVTGDTRLSDGIVFQDTLLAVFLQFGPKNSASAGQSTIAVSRYNGDDANPAWVAIERDFPAASGNPQFFLGADGVLKVFYTTGTTIADSALHEATFNGDLINPGWTHSVVTLSDGISPKNFRLAEVKATPHLVWRAPNASAVGGRLFISQWADGKWQRIDGTTEGLNGFPNASWNIIDVIGFQDDLVVTYQQFDGSQTDMLVIAATPTNI